MTVVLMTVGYILIRVLTRGGWYVVVRQEGRGKLSAKAHDHVVNHEAA